MAGATGGIVLLLALFHPALAAEKEQTFLAITTGGRKSTAYQIGLDLKDLSKGYNLHLAACPSKGSVENIFAVSQRPGNHLGIVQTDVLAFVSKFNADPQLARIEKTVRWVYPLYRQEVHLLASDIVSHFSDLSGKRVGIGPPESGSYLTSRLLFEIADVTPQQLFILDDARALAALKAGTLDAMLVIDGMPVKRLVSGIQPADRLHLVPITHKGIRSFYPAARIPAGTYAWQTADVETVSVGTVLVAYNFHDYHCDAIGELAYLIRENLSWLKANGHPKWRTVNLDADVQGWRPYDCVTGYIPPVDLRANQSLRANPSNPVAKAIQTVFRP
ncbi:C4-dicarboxylate ABC transporter substrate-binding protein [Desulfosarcina ovata subsp. sediminis]|uniref:C4-dicarboxylate ABC transporter substrate-binding protein n=1 Tax=Desulfosarcina ovata subsp. sediminis TaxID=885957 RepID=A0A5K8A1R2_9BACT|nr:C4-dicarboxylate ABC transporter substrate-binding protein [Desulfosarcina ovata subsp. sediminis]